MGLYSILARFLAPRKTKQPSFSERLQADPFVFRQLERRRVLDASAAGALLAPLGDMSDTVQAGDNFASEPPAEETEVDQSTIAMNTGPSNLQLFLPMDVSEDGTVQLGLIFDDPDLNDSHTVDIDWGDGTPVETINITGTALLTSHQYLDDNPTDTPSDMNEVMVTVTDSYGESVSASTTIEVLNVDPEITFMQVIPGSINENGAVTLQLAFDDIGSEDTHTVEIDWGDGSGLETIELTSGERSLVTSHIYLDDDPSNTASDDYTVSVTVVDDDTGASDTATDVVTVNNVAPEITFLAVLPDTINENDSVTLQLAFDDIGSEDTHTVEINWGDGSGLETITLTTGERSLVTSHMFLDDDPSNTDSDVYTISVTVKDDDTGVSDTATTMVTVNNVAPVVILDPITDINENGDASLSGTVTDIGSLDTFTLEINWGDPLSPDDDQSFTLGTTALTEAVDGINWNPLTGEFSLTHQYLDDNPTATTSDTYTISATATDDDNGVSDTATTMVTVNNVAPIVTIDGEPASSPEGTQINLSSTVVDPGSLDTFTYMWEVTVGGNVVATGSDPTFSFTPADNGTHLVTLTVTDDDTQMGSDSVSIEVTNVAPTLDPLPNLTINEGDFITLPPATFTDPGFDLPAAGTQENFTATIDWGDGTTEPALDITLVELPGSEGVLTTGTIQATHAYADDGIYTVTLTVTDDDGLSATQNFNVTVNNVAPTLDPLPNLTINEGDFITLPPATFTDPGFDLPAAGTQENFTATIDWGDGTTEPALDITLVELPGSEGVLTTGTIQATHAYADDGIYTVTLTVTDDDGLSATQNFNVTVNNVAPTLDPLPNLTINEGDFITLPPATFTDPGFDLPAAGTQENFTATIDWGDGTTEPALDITLVELPGSEGVLTTGTIQATHAYADDGIYTVTLTVTDDDGLSATQNFNVTVNNVAPTLDPLPNLTINEGDFITLPPATFTDPGFDLPAAGTQENFTATIDWGDGTTEPALDITLVELPGSEGVLTTGTIQATHAYADDGIYTVTLTVTDDDGLSATQNFNVTVNNVAPTLDPLPNLTINEGDFITLPPATFTDPGFDLPAAGTQENFTATIDWGDGTTEPALDITLVELPGSEGVLTTGTIQATHAYADDGIYTVTLTVTDDDGLSATQNFNVTVNNVAPTLDPLPNLTINEGDFITLPPATFTDPGFDLPAAGTQENFTATIDWGDGTTEPALDITLVELPGSEGVLTTGTIQATHAYADDGIYTVTLTVTDDDGLSATQNFNVTVNNVAPTLDPLPNLTINEGDFITLPPATFTDPGFDLPAAGTQENFTATIDWGDGTTEPALDITLVELPGSEGVLTTGTIQATHAYADDGIYTVTLTVTDDDGLSATQNFNVTVNNVAPTLDPLPNLTINEGDFITLPPATFTDPGFDLPAAGTQENFTATIDWGDGTTEPALDITLVELPGSEGVLTTGTIQATHAYADDGIYTVTLTVTDDDGLSATQNFNVTVNNVAPTLDPLPNLTINEGDFITLPPATFTDPGFDLPAAGTQENFTATIDWGDGTTEPALDITLVELPGSEGVLTTGTIQATHAYADDGIYTVTLTVTDDDGLSATQNFNVTVNNVAPTLDPLPNLTINEGDFITLPPATFTDPGFDLPAAGTQENFTATIDWGDGTTEPALDITLVELPGSEGVLTTGTIQATHAYADDGIYTVTLTVTDDDGLSATQNFNVTVNNVAPPLDPIDDVFADEGEFISLPPANFSDPGFDLDPAGTEENFTATVDWGDGTTEPQVDITLIEIPGGEGVLTTGTIAASHAYADNGTYTVTVTITDDDGLSTSRNFDVIVSNVDPELTGGDAGPFVLDEGEIFTLSDFGVGLSDPGFTLAAAGTMETFNLVSVDWGDGSTPFAAADLSVFDVQNGSEGVLTTALFESSAYAYADNGSYTVTLTFADDDGGTTVSTIEVIVNNVAPTLELTQGIFIINESETLDLTDPDLANPDDTLATFSDPGFDNAALGTQETFSYTIDWGDGTVETGVLPSETISGSQGVLTVGTLLDMHQYVDNDVDGIYTITVTLTDDDGGSVTESFTIQVNNIPPTLDPLIATDVNTSGETTLTLTFTDPGQEQLFVEFGDDPFTVLVDWGYMLGDPSMDGFQEEFVYAGDTPGTFIVVHTYSEPPNPASPASDITIQVVIQDDDFMNPQVADNSASNVEIVVITNPGIGDQPVRIDTTPQVPRLSFVRENVTTTTFQVSTTSEVSNSGGDLRSSSSDANATTEQILELRVVDPYGEESEGIRLKSEVLNNLPGLFSKLPDNHYVIYLVRQETNSQRLVIEVYLREGQIIDPGDDSDSMRKRPPVEIKIDVNDQPAADSQDAEVSAILQQIREKIQQELSPTERVISDPVDQSTSSNARNAHLMSVATGLVATRSFGTWARRADRALAQANKKKWRQLRRRNRSQRKNQ